MWDRRLPDTTPEKGEIANKLRDLQVKIDGLVNMFAETEDSVRSYSNHKMPFNVSYNADLKAFLEMIASIRRLRNSIFNCDEIFFDPAWDIVVDLMINEANGNAVCIKSACIASNVPATTALRWIKILEKNGLVERENDSKDGRRQFLKLTSKCKERILLLYRDFFKLNETCYGF